MSATENSEPGQPLAVPLSDQLGLVAKLRDPAQATNWGAADNLMNEAADEIERQKVRIDGLMFDALGEPRTRYVRVTLSGSHCVMHPSEGDCYVKEARNAGDPDWERYIVRDVWLSEREFEDLPEFDGF